MNITELKNDNTNFHVRVLIPSHDLEKEVEKELAKIAKTAKMPGFRVGKVPSSVLKKRYNDSLKYEALKNKISSSIVDIIQDKKLRTIEDPEVVDLKNDEGQDIEYTLKFALLPEISIPDLKKISIEKPILEVKDKDIDKQVDRMKELTKTYDKPNKVKAKSGDQVTIDAIGYVNDEAFEGGNLSAHKLVLGSGTFIPGFEDQLIGTKNGSEVDVKVTFPTNYQAADLAGKPAVFKVKVLEVHSLSETKIDDEFAKKFNCENLEKLREQISQNIQLSYEESIHNIMKMSLFDKLETMLKFDIPETLLEKEKAILKNQAKQLGEDDETLANKSEDELSEYYSKIALRRVKLGLFLAEYVKQKNLQISEQDVRKAIIAQARNYPGQEKQVIEYFQKDKRAIESLKGPVLEEKAVETIFEKEVKITEKSYTIEKLEKMLEKD